MNQVCLDHPGDQGRAAAGEGSTTDAPAAHPFDDAVPFPGSSVIGLDSACGIAAAAAKEKIDQKSRLDKEMRQIKNFADQGLWHGVHVALRWYTKSLVTSGRTEAIAMVDEMNTKVAEARIREPSRGWGDFPQGRILWTGPLKFPAAVLEAGGQASGV